MTDLATLSHRIIDEVWNKKNIDAGSALVCASGGPSRGHRVFIRNLVFDGEVKVGKCAEILANELFVAVQSLVHGVGVVYHEVG